MHWVSTICMTYARFENVQRKMQVPLPKNLVNGPLKELLPAVWLPTAGEGCGIVLLLQQRGRKPSASFTEVKQEDFPGGAVVKICLPMQETRVRALVQQDPTCRGATKPVCHNYWAWALELAGHNYWSPRA